MGSRQSEHPESILRRIPGAVPTDIPADTPNGIVFPHLFGEYKAPGKNYLQAEARARYDAAIGVALRKKALDIVDAPDPPGTAQIGSYTNDGHILRLFAHYEEDSGYYQYSVFNSFMTSTKEFGVGYKKFRNFQQWAKDNATELKDAIYSFHEAEVSGEREISAT